MTTTKQTRRSADALVNVARAGELLGLHAATVSAAIDAEEIPVTPIEGSGGRTTYAVSVGDLRKYRAAKVKEWKSKPGDVHQARAKILEEREL